MADFKESSESFLEQSDAEKAHSSNEIVESSTDLIEKQTDGNEPLSPKPNFGAKLWVFVKKNWFLEGLVISVLLAAVYPPFGKKGGIIRSEYTISYGVVALIFIISGISLKTKVLIKAVLNWRMHLIIQGLSLGLTPLIGFALKSLLLVTPFDSNLAAGIAVACSTPTTISSNVLMTKNSYGSESVALTNAVIGNILGVFISPLLIFLFLGSSGSRQFDLSGVFVSLTLTVLVPLIVGQIFQYIFPKSVAKIAATLPLANINSLLLLFMAYVIAVVFCASTKTLALGIPLINVLFASDPNIGIISTPLLMYHAEQLIFGSIMVTWFQKWSKDERDEDDEVLPQKTEPK
ncbi:hypothetical protein HK096_005814 [Nowakowskiella sp. JEL0078]|nr:hypothetical protein HK096_005814 [Nowakowskiella sp. JEL0078]